MAEREQEKRRRKNALNNEFNFVRKDCCALQRKRPAREMLPRRSEFYLRENTLHFYGLIATYLCANVSKFSYGLIQYAAGNVLSKVQRKERPSVFISRNGNVWLVMRAVTAVITYVKPVNEGEWKPVMKAAFIIT